MEKYTNKSTATAKTDIDQGLRSFMISVYNYMAAGLGLTGIVAYIVASSPQLANVIHGTPLRWVAMLAPLLLVFYLAGRINKMSLKKAKTTFWIYASLMGLSLSYIFLLYTGESIARTFFISSSVFLSMSLYGYTTKKDLTGMGSFLLMGLFGIIIASIVNIFLKSSGLNFAVSVLGVLIFTGLTAYDTQKIKGYYSDSDSSESTGKKAVMGALSLYLDFINLFIYLLRFMGDRR